MTCDKIIAEKEFGHLYIRVNSRAVRFTFRPARDGSPQCGLLVTVPPYYTQANLLDAVERNRQQLRSMVKEFTFNPAAGQHQPSSRPCIDYDFSIHTECLVISIVAGTRPGFYLHNQEATIQHDKQGNELVVKPAQLQVVCPPDCNFNADGFQTWIENAIVEGIRQHAKVQLIPRLRDYARRYGIVLNEVKVNSSKGRWGSCVHRERKGPQGTQQSYNINLSLFTLLLPLQLQRLVMLHELNHTRHMDHSPAFHRDLNRWLNGQEDALELQLKQFDSSIFSFVDNKAAK